MKRLLYFIICWVFTSSSFAQDSALIDQQTVYYYPMRFDSIGKQSVAPRLNLIARQSQIIAMGESTHGTKEFYQVKNFIIPFLVEYCGYRSIFFESSFGSLLFINEYIKKGEGNIDSLLRRNGYWLYYTPELKELFNWLKQYNAGKDASQQVSVYGMDMQVADDALHYFSLSLHHQHYYIDSLLTPLLNAATGKASKSAQDQIVDRSQQIRKTIPLLQRWLEQNRSKLIAANDSLHYFLLERCLRNANFAINNRPEDLPYRDSCMADNIISTVKFTQQKTFVWAHNGHIGLKDTLVNYDFLRFPMGQILEQTFKELYYPIGLLVGEGKFLALERKKREKTFVYPNLRVFEFKSPGPDFLSSKISDTGPISFFPDIHKSTPLFWKKYYKTYMAGSIYNPKGNNIFYITVGQVYKGLLHFNTGTAISQIDNFFYTIK